MASEREPTVSGFHPRLEQLVQDENFAVGTLDQYLLLVWRKQITTAGANAASAAMVRLYAQRPTQRLGFVTLIDAGCSLSTSSEVRELLSTMLKNHNYVIGAAAIAYEGEGFWSAMARSVITAINVASRAVFPSDVTAKLDDAVNFVTRQLGDGSDLRRRTLMTQLQAMRGGGGANDGRGRGGTRRLQGWSGRK